MASMNNVRRYGVWRYIFVKSCASENTSARAQISTLCKLFRVTSLIFGHILTE